MQIEIMDSDVGCQMKCITCPRSIQKMEGSSRHLMPRAFQMLQDKLGDIPFGVSFMGDLPDILKLIDKYQVKKNISELGSYIKLPIDMPKFEGTLKELSKMFPGAMINLGTLYKESGISDHIIPWITDIGKSFFAMEFDLGTGLPGLQLSFNNNSLSLQNYNEHISGIRENDRAFYGKIATEVGGHPFRVHNFVDNPYVESYDSALVLKIPGKTLQITRRIISRILEKMPVGDTSYYYERARRDVELGEEFTLETLGFMLTPMGVRINHKASDVNNPYFWITYEDLFWRLERSSDIDFFCSEMRTVVNMTLALPLKDLRFEKVDEWTINELSQRRKGLLNFLLQE